MNLNPLEVWSFFYPYCHGRPISDHIFLVKAGLPTGGLAGYGKRACGTQRPFVDTRLKSSLKF
jgi:hypothetical protein